MTYSAPAVNFDGATGLSCASLTCVDSQNVSFFFTYRKMKNESNLLFVSEPAGNGQNYAQLTNDGGTYLDVQLRQHAFGGGLQISFKVPSPNDLIWHTGLFSVDTSTGANALYIDDALIGVFDVFFAATTPAFNGYPLNFGNNGFGDGINGDVSNFWLGVGVSLLSGSTIPAPTRRLFTDSSNKPLDPSGYPAGGTVIFSGNASTYANNLGSGGVFTVFTGALTNATTRPSDTLTIKTKVYTTTGNITIPLPSWFNITDNIAHAIGGGVCGSPGFSGAISHADSPFSDWNVSALAGPGGHYVTSYDLPLNAGDVLGAHVAISSPCPPTLEQWRNDYFGSPSLSDDTWLKDGNGTIILQAVGGDSSSSDIGDHAVEGGFGNVVGNFSGGFASSGGGGGAGSPFGAGSGSTCDGARPGSVDPTSIKQFGAGGGDALLDESDSAAVPGSGNRTTAGSGAGSGPSSGGDGGNITGNVALSSSLQLPCKTVHNSAYGAVTDTSFNPGNLAFTIELWTFDPLPKPGADSAGSWLSVWDRGTNQQGWLVSFGSFNWQMWYSITGADQAMFGHDLTRTFAENPRLGTDFSYSVGFLSALSWVHRAWVWDGANTFLFVDGYPSIAAQDADFHYAGAPLLGPIFASTAPLVVGNVLDNGVPAAAITQGQLADGPAAGWIGQVRISLGAALYTCATTSPNDGSPPLGQQFTPPANPGDMAGGDFNCNWPGNKGDTNSTWYDNASNPHAFVSFAGTAQIDSDQYCYPPPPGDEEIGGDGEPGVDGALWTDTDTSEVVGPGGGGGGAGGDLARYRMKTGGIGGKGGKYGGPGGQGGGVNSISYAGLGINDAQFGLGGLGESGLIVIQSLVTASEISEPATASDAVDAQRTIHGAVSEPVTASDVVDAVLVPRPKWMTIGGDARTSIFPK